MSSPAGPASASPAQEHRLHPWSWLFVLIQQLRQFIVPLAALLVFGSRGDRYEVMAGLAPLIAVAVLALTSVMQYLTFRYRIGQDGLSVREGWLHRSQREIPYARIHNVVVHQSLLHRMFGVAEVRLESAGGQKPEAQMRVLGLDAALALEDLIRHRGQDAAVAGESAPAAPGTLLALPTGEILRLGLVSNRGMIVVAAAFGAAWQFLPEDRMGGWMRLATRQASGYVSHLQWGWLSTAVSVATLIALAALLLRGLSVLLALLQYHGFRLSEDPRRLTVERGLLARLRTSIARRRIQSWTLQETLLHRWFGRRSLRIDTAVAEQQQQGEQRALKELAPIATPEACDALVRHLLPQAHWPRGDWRPLPASSWWRLFLPGVPWMLLAAAAVAFFIGPWGWLVLLWLPWSAYGARLHARHAAYAVDERMVAVRGGWWSRWWRFAEIDKLQALRLSRSPLDRRLGTASLWLDTAGATGLAPPLRIRFLPEADAQALYDSLSAALAGRRLRW
ncbi:PH domain-containing protein [Pseudoxanthomonas mexicana]|uniref:PH domain-containing protein n=1 Tax=Pseudoxanthomonas mexicana TaxID=128785 RepID=UPI00398B3405